MSIWGFFFNPIRIQVINMGGGGGIKHVGIFGTCFKIKFLNSYLLIYV
jgi:hypothetical protein